MKRLENMEFVFGKDFSFIYKGKVIFRCNRFSAAFISPYVLKLLQNDFTIGSFIIDSCEFNQEEEEKVQEMMKSLVQKGKIEIINDSKYEKTIGLIHKLSETLGNDEIIHQIDIKTFYYEGISISEAIQNLHNSRNSRILNNSQTNKNYNKLISFLSSKFNECMNECFDTLNEDHLYEILSQSNLQIDDEDSLFECIHKNEQFHHLLEFISFENLNEINISKYFDLLSPENINLQIWQKISSFCIQSNKKSSIPFIEQERDPFNGIFQYLTRLYQGNPHCKGIINITELSNCCGKVYDVINKGNITDYDNNQDDENSFWQVDFKSHKVCLTGYSIKSQREYNSSCGYMINWNIEGSNDGKQWKILDQKNNSNDLIGDFKSHSWKIDNKTYYQFIRLKGTNKTTNGSYKSLRFCEIEFFGYLYN
ncbi:hypothetical protein TRFO_37783 [Tritrichomonas foetus]|uniref:F5/8 type C domain-containing protein n=1 Tax=Tritrichomonas foetus TaxID=1144522 RepID=A0A1J4JEK9_9EUKA|nr:hypothetical protein TRFO_37783 [Tritrichomonas foetus]|eukprot:OHS96083.1 hypothetical protein TRFO_37783 [Tritrichomonas foetus]